VDEDRFDRLTERQRECLRLVHHGHEVKEIARALRIGPSAVVERLRAARKTLDVDNSRLAARMLAEHEGNTTYIRHVDMPDWLAEPGLAPALLEPSRAEGPGEAHRDRVMEAPASFEALPILLPAKGFPWPFRTGERSNNDLTHTERLVMSVCLTVVFAIAASMSVIAVIMLMQFLRELAKHGG
jgi:DNA-binding CsgD family transcriptional regulator